MLYDKSHFKKVNDKKVLHKVKKHWVTLSLATLMCLGGTGLVASTTTHASQTGDNSSSNNANPSLNNNSQGDNHSSQLVNNYNNDQTDHLANREKASIDANDQPKGINALNQAQSKFKADFSTANLLRDNRAYMNNQGRINSITQPSVNEQQVKSAASEAGYHDQIMAEAQEHWDTLGDRRNVHPRRLLGTGEEDPQAKLANLQNQINKISDFQQQFQQYQASLTSASNFAAGEMADYYDVESVSDPHFEGPSYIKSDSAASASTSAINDDIAKMPTQSMTVDSITASLAGSEAIDYKADPDNHADQITSLSNKVSALYNEASNYNKAASNSAADANNDANAVYNDFSDERYGATHGNKYPITNVDDARSFEGALNNPNVHQINIVGNIDCWDADASGQLMPGLLRDVTINGLNDDGTRNTIDFADTEANFNTGDYSSDKTYKFTIENLHMYGIRSDGPIGVSLDTQEQPMHADIIYNNITYDGGQLSYDSAPGGAQSSVNVNVIFQGKDIVTTGAYSPDGTVGDYTSKYAIYGTGYDYDTGGIPAHPFDGDGKIDDYGDTKNIADPQTYDGTSQPKDNINDASNQQDIQVASGRSVIFDTGCDFTGYTSNGDNITANHGSMIQLKPDSQVHLIPRGNYAQPPQQKSYLGKMPVGIDIDGEGSLEVDSGAKLIITPTDEDNDFNNLNDNFSNMNNNYYPGAIYVRSDNGEPAKIDIKSGGEIDVKYPTQHSSYKNSTESIPDPTLGNNTDTNGDQIDNPSGAITLGGDATITIERDGRLTVDGGDPVSSNTSKTNGILVAMTGSNAGNQVNAEPGSRVQLITGGSQPMTLFQAPYGTQINVDDPKIFRLNFTKNTNPNSQLASQGTGIKGSHVEALDEHDHNFGQYGYVVFPGDVFPPDSEVYKDIDQGIIVNKVMNTYHVLDTALTKYYGASVASAISSKLPDANTLIHNLENIYPYAEQPLQTTTGKKLYNEFNNSLDLPYTVMKQVQQTVNASPVGSQHPITDGQVIMWAKQAGSKDPTNDELMKYNGQLVFINGKGTGFNLTKGFSFNGVPDTYVEGISLTGDTLSGYSFPGSYIRVTDVTTGHPITTSHMLDDHKPYNDDEAYDPGDISQYHGDYITAADPKTGHWTIQLPAGINASSLSVTAHTQTVSPDNATRLVTSYIDGRNEVTTGNGHDTIDTADTYDANASHIPTEVYNDDETPGLYDAEIDSKVPQDRKSDQVDDHNAGQDFAAGYIKGEHDRDNLTTDNSIYSKPAPFILGYKLAQAENDGIKDEQTFSVDKNKIDDTAFQYDDYLRRVIADHSAASSNETEILGTSGDVSNVIKSLSSAPAGYSGSLSSTSGSVANASTSASSSVANASSQVSAVSSIDRWASGISTDFSGVSAEFSADDSNYNSYYGGALAAQAAHNEIAEETSLIEARAAESAMNTDVAAADNLAKEITSNETSASDDNQAASSDSDSVSTSTLDVETSASNNVASAFSFSASSYSTAVHSASSSATKSNTSIGTKTAALSASGNQISMEYTELSNLESKFPSLSASLSKYNVASASSLASNNDVLASTYSQSASSANNALNTESGDATLLSSAVGSLSTAVSGLVQRSAYTLAGSYNGANGKLMGQINSSYATNSSTVDSELSNVNSLNDSDASFVMSEALSAAENDINQYNTLIEIDSGIAMGASSAVSNVSSDDSTDIAHDSAAKAAIAKDSSIISSTEIAIASDYSTGNSSDANKQASSADSAQSDAENQASSAESLANEIKDYSEIVQTESSATNFMINGSGMSNVSDAINDAGVSGSITSDEAVIATAKVKISSYMSDDDVIDASTQASLAESANSNAQSIANSAMGVDATRVVPITFMVSLSNSNYSQVGCQNDTLAGHVGETISSLSSKAPAPAGYSYDPNQPVATNYIHNNSYTFVKDNIDQGLAGYMNPMNVLVDGDQTSAEVQFIDEDGNVIYTAPLSNPNNPNGTTYMGDTVTIPSLPDNLGDTYTVDTVGADSMKQPPQVNQQYMPSQSYTFAPKNMQPNQSGSVKQMKPVKVNVYKNRTFHFSIEAEKLVNGRDNHCPDVTDEYITGKDGDVRVIKPTDKGLVPAGFTSDRNNKSVTVEITTAGLELINSEGTVKERNGQIPKIVWKYKALSSTNTSKTDTSKNTPKPIKIDFVDVENDNGNPPQYSTDPSVGNGVVNGDTDQWINALSQVSVPDGYQVVPGANVMWQINTSPQTQYVPVVPEMAVSAMINYVEVTPAKKSDPSLVTKDDQGNVITHNVIAQRAIVQKVGTNLDSVDSQYTDDVPYGYQWDNATNWDANTKVADDGQYDVYITRQPNDPTKVAIPADNDMKINKNNGEIIINYVDPNNKLILSQKYFGSSSINPTIPASFNYSPSAIPSAMTNGDIPYEHGKIQTYTIHILSRTDQSVKANIEYYDPENSTSVQSIQISGHEGDPIDYDQYQQFIPTGYRYIGMGSHDSGLVNGDTNVILIEKAQTTSLGSITVNYVNGETGQKAQTYDSVKLNGVANTGFDLSYYENNLPSSISDARFVKADNVPLTFTNGDQNVNITVQTPTMSTDYGNIHVYFVKADAVNADPTGFSNALETLKSTGSENKAPASGGQAFESFEVPFSQPVVMTGHDGDVFTPEAYEYNLPADTTFDTIEAGSKIVSFTKGDQYLVIGVDTTNGAF